MVRASLLSALGLWSGSSPQLCNSAALATAELCKSSVILAKILKQSKSSRSAPDQNITCAGLSQERHEAKFFTLHEIHIQIQSYMNSDMSSEVRLARKKKLQLLAKIINLCTSTETPGSYFCCSFSFAVTLTMIKYFSFMTDVDDVQHQWMPSSWSIRAKCQWNRFLKLKSL